MLQIFGPRSGESEIGKGANKICYVDVRFRQMHSGLHTYYIYLVLKEPGREKLRIGTGQRAMKFEEEAKKEEGRKLLNECVKNEEGQVQTTVKREERCLRRNRASQLGVEQLRREGQETVLKGFKAKG